MFSSKIWVHFIRGGSIGLLLVAEAGLALGPLGRFQNEMEKELRPGAGEGSCYRYEKKPDSYRASELRRQDSFFIERCRYVAYGGGDMETRGNCDREHVKGPAIDTKKAR